MKLEAKEIRTMLAPFYSKACMDERANMQEITALLEYARELFEKNYAYEVWNNIRLDRLRFDKEPFTEYLGELRHAFLTLVTENVIRNIKNVCRWDMNKGFETWLNEYAHSLTWWRDYVYESLCETDFQFTAEQQEKVNQYRELNAFILDTKWPEAFDYFVELSDIQQFDRLIRSNLKIISGEIKLFWRPDYHHAIFFFEEAKKICPENPRVERGMGEYFAHTGEYEKAKNHFLAAISLAPNDIENYIGMGNTFLNEGNREAAEKWYKDGVNMNFLEYYPYSRIVNLYNTPERIEGKEEIIETYLSKVTQFEAYTLSTNSLYSFYRDIGLTYLSAKKYDKAFQFYKSADALKPDLTAAKVDLGYTCCHAKKFEEAENWINRSLKEDEKWNFDSHWALAWLYEQIAAEKEDGSDKEKYYRKAIEKYTLCKSIRKAWSDRCYNLIGILFYKLGLYDEAAENYDLAIKNNPSEVVYYTNKRDAIERAGAAPDQLEKVLIEICQVMPSGAEHYNRLAVFYHDQGNYLKAIPLYDKAITLNPNSALYLENRGLALLNLKEYEKAELDYKQSATLSPNHKIYNKLGVLYYNWGHYDDALQFYLKAIELNDKEPIYFENLGLVHERMKDDSKAIGAYEKAIALERTNGIYLNRLGLFYYNKADDLKAVGYYQKAIEREPDNTTYLQNLALAHEQLHRDDDAEKIYEQLVNRDSNNINSSVRLAVIKMRRGIYDEIVYKYLNAAVQQNPENLQYLEYLGYYFEKSNRFDDALRTYEKALTIDPGNEYFNNRLGIILYTNGTVSNVEKAVEYYKKAIEKNERAAVYWQNLGLAYEYLGRYMDAEAAYLESIKIDSHNDEYLNFIGVFYNNKIMNYEKAIAYYKQAAAINPKPIYYSNIGYAYSLMNEHELATEANAKAQSLSEGMPEHIQNKK
ncbi:MAG TPA: tetratricopeptide repeat protein [Cyclobacteriaceae bacterium]|nr:tetratricopeptide repeat protein [Cyclobacteriaceae bacterium]